MRTERRFTCNLFAIASAVLATLFLVACQQSQAPAPTTASPKAALTQVLVIFEGPWAIVPDPNDPNSILAIAPRTKIHRPLAVAPADAELEAGIYELTVPASPAPPIANLDPSFFQTKVDPKNVQAALNAKLGRYAVRLPRPEAYLAESRYQSRVAGPPYPPPASTQNEYVTAISLRYSVSSLTGFSLAGTPDTGPTYNPLLLRLETPVVRFEIVPSDYHPHDPCEIHARETFRHLVGLMGLTLYVDFPKYAAECQKIDPQNPQNTQHKEAELLHGLPLEPMAGLFAEDVGAPEAAGVVGDIFAIRPGFALPSIANRLAAFYFFTTGGGGCKTPIIVGGGG